MPKIAKDKSLEANPLSSLDIIEVRSSLDFLKDSIKKRRISEGPIQFDLKPHSKVEAFRKERHSQR